MSSYRKYQRFGTKFFFTITFGIVLSLISKSLLAQDTIALITSLDDQEEPYFRQFFRVLVGQNSNDLTLHENKFKNIYENQGYLVEIIRKGDLYSFRKALHDSTAKAVFWISHSGRGTNHFPGLSIPSVITDFRGSDVSGVIRDFNPNLRLLVIGGCNSKAAVEKVQRRYSLTERYPDVQILGIDGSDGWMGRMSGGVIFFREVISHFVSQEMQKILQNSKERLSLPASLEEEMVDTVSLRIRRKISEKYYDSNIGPLCPAILEFQGKILDVFPALETHVGSQTLTLLLRSELLSPNLSQSITLNSGFRTAQFQQETCLGFLEIETVPDVGYWTIQRTTTGEPSGVSQNVYHFHPHSHSPSHLSP